MGGLGQIAGVTLLLFVLLLPGFAFRRLYYTGPFSKQYAKARLDSLLVAAFVPAVLLQLAAYYFTSIDTRWFYSFLVDGTLGSRPGALLTIAEVHPVGAVVLEQILYIVYGGLWGVFFRTIIRSRGYDRKYKILRFDNVWQYILRGEVFEFPEVRRNLGMKAKQLELTDFEEVALDILAVVGGEPVIYKGTLLDYHLAAEGTLKYVVLTGASRRVLSEDPQYLGKPTAKVPSTRSKRFYQIPGDMVVLKGEYIANVNVRFARLELRPDTKDFYAVYGEPVHLYPAES